MNDVSEVDDDLKPGHGVPVRTFICHCGKTVMQSSQIGNPPACVGCMECNSTLANNKNDVKQRKLHNWENDGIEKVCLNCGTRELLEQD